ncbi:MAG: OmpA family protein [Bacteroidales bacterium]|nr:OmpA family protein [Candidatus Physcocola equi]
MNKKLFAILLSCATAANLYAQEQEENNQEATTSQPKGFCHWSVQGHGGLNFLKGVDNNGYGYFDGYNLNGMGGAQVEYTFTPYWGLGFDCTYNHNDQRWYENELVDFSLFASVNLSNLLAPNRQWDRFSAYLNLGFGTCLTSWKNAFYIEDGKRTDIEDKTRFSRPFVQPGLNLEYNISKSWAVSLQGDMLIGMTESGNSSTMAIHPTSDGGSILLMGGVGVRYKFAGDRNIRNVVPGALTAQATNNECCSELQRLLDEYKNEQNKLSEEVAAMNAELEKAKADNKSLKKDLRDSQDSLDALNHRFRAYVNKPSSEDLNTINTAMARLRFETAKAVIMKGSYANLDRIAALMAKNPTWNAKIEGHTDNVGDPKLNQKLSEDRAAAVVQYLVGKGININRLSNQGFGDTRPVADNKTESGRARNRRVELEVIVK